MVDYRRFDCDDHRVRGHGSRQYRVGQPVRPPWAPPRRPRRLDNPGRQPGARQPHPIAIGIPADLRRPGRRRNGSDLRPHDGLRDGLVRNPAEPRGVPRFCGHGDGADDHVAVGGLARFELRLADGAADHQRPGGGHHDSGRVPRAQSTGAGRPGRRGRCHPGFRAGDVPRAGAAFASVHHPLADELFLLRHPFRPDLPHRELCRDLRHSADHGRVDL